MAAPTKAVSVLLERKQRKQRKQRQARPGRPLRGLAFRQPYGRGPVSRVDEAPEQHVAVLSVLGERQPEDLVAISPIAGYPAVRPGIGPFRDEQIPAALQQDGPVLGIRQFVDEAAGHVVMDMIDESRAVLAESKLPAVGYPQQQPPAAHAAPIEPIGRANVRTTITNA